MNKNLYVILLIVFLMIGGIGGWFLATGQNQQITNSQELIASQPNINQEEMSKKTVRALPGVVFEVPADWNVFSNSDNIGRNNLPQNPTVAVGMDDVSFGEMNLNQIDFYASEINLDTVLDQDERFSYMTDLEPKIIAHVWQCDAGDCSDLIETNQIVTAKVYQHPLDNGTVSKAGTGGQVYFIENNILGVPKTIVIDKQAKGDDEFEAGFTEIIKSLKFISNN